MKLVLRSPLWLGILAALATGCGNDLLWAVGQTEKVGLVTSFSLRDRRVDQLASVLEDPVQMVRPENRFVVDRIPLDLFSSNRDWKAMAVLTDLSRPGALDDEIARLISAREREIMSASGTAYRLIENVWARGQCVLLVHAKDPGALEAFLAERGDAMAASFDEALQVAIGPSVLSIGHDEAMEAYLRTHYGFEIGIPKGYLTGEDTEGRVVRLYRVIEGEPARFVLIHWMPAADRPRTVEQLFTLRDDLGYVYYQGDHVLRERSRGYEGRFQGEPALVLEGVWQNDRYVIGGPFRTFGFVRGDRFFLLDVAVFNPPGKKLPFLRETLAIARTFRPVEAS